MPDPSDPPVAGPDPTDETPRPPRLRGWGGCLLWAVAFVFVVVAGCSIGLVLRPDPEAGRIPETAATGDGWSLRVRVDEADDPCTELFAGPDPVSAQCGYLVDGAYRITSAAIERDRYVAFGPTPDDAAEVVLRFTDGTRTTVPTDRENGVQFFVVERDVDVDGPATLLDADGNEITP